MPISDRRDAPARDPLLGPRPALLSRDSHVALYMQIAQWLEGEIAEGRLAPQARLDPEHALMQRFGVSRITVRQAIDHLVAKGLILRKQGKGTFVAGPALRHDLQDLRGFFETFLAQGINQGVNSETRLLRFQAAPPPAEAARALGLALGEQAMALERLYSLDGQPIALSSTWLTPEARRVSWEEAESRSSYSILQDLLGIRIAQADIRIRSERTGRAVRRQLKLPAQVPVLVLRRTSYDSQGVGREVTRFAVNSESFEFTLSARGPTPISSAPRAIAAAE